MKTAITFMCVIVLLAASSPLALAGAVAGRGKGAADTETKNTVPKTTSTVPATTSTVPTTTITVNNTNNGNGNSQAGGLPALAARVQQLETGMVAVISQIDLIKNAITGLQNAITSLESAVNALQSNVQTLIGVVGNLAKSVTSLQGQNNWAVVTSTGDTVRHSGGATDVKATKLSTGTYEVTFAKDVTGCAYVATIGDPGKASATPGFTTVSSGALGNPNDVQVQTFDKSGTAADMAFHLYVSCP